MSNAVLNLQNILLSKIGNVFFLSNSSVGPSCRLIIEKFVKNEEQMFITMAKLFDYQGKIMNKLIFFVVYIYLILAVFLLNWIFLLCLLIGLLRKRGMMMRKINKRF